MWAGYLKFLATVQVIRFDRPGFLTDQQSFYFASKSVGFLPLMHAISIVALLHLLSYLYSWPAFIHPLVVAVAMAPFLAAFAFVGLNYDFMQLERMRLKALPEAALSKCKRAARIGVVTSWVAAVFSFSLMIFLESKHGA